MSLYEHIKIYQPVQDALNNNLPVVALESTIITHGMPYPQNLEMAQKVEDIVRENGAVPATIAILKGKIHIGLSPEELIDLAQEKDVVKLSRRDLAIVIAKKLNGATTVAATMICAKLAGIKFFVTGGIGGVHRGFEETMDVSGDLEELSNTDVHVICAGAKAILDLPRTLEYLETKGVCVIGYGTEELPAFYTRKSGMALQWRCDDPTEIASIIKVKEDLGLKGSVLITNPIPQESSMDESFINSVIEEALQDSVHENISGKDTTPFLLQRIVDKTEGKSLMANIALVYNNAKLGAKIAKAYSENS